MLHLPELLKQMVALMVTPVWVFLGPKYPQTSQRVFDMFTTSETYFSVMLSKVVIALKP